MSRDDIARKYAPLLARRKITLAQFDLLLTFAKNLDAPDMIQGVEAIKEAFGGVEIPPNAKETHIASPGATGTSQTARLLTLLQDGAWHTTPEIQEKVYGADHLGIARIASRVADLKKEGHDIVSEKDAGTIWKYRLNKQQTLP